METVKVDLQKLQLLNDRIAQTIEALNQLRLSTHGLQHAGMFAQTAASGSPSYGYPQAPYPQAAYPQAAFPQAAYAQAAYPQAAFPQGVVPQATVPQPVFPQPAFPQSVYPQGIYPTQFSPIAVPQPGQGISHSSPAAQTFPQNGSSVYGWIDPGMQQRIQQAFPFLTSVYSPIV